MSENQAQVRFDESLPKLLEVLKAELSPEVVASGVVVRDTTGRLSFFCPTELSQAELERVGKRLVATLGPYAHVSRVIAGRSESGAASILADRSAVPLLVEGHRQCWVIDRRLVGSDWLIEPVSEEAHPPRIVFASLKGGVGRSTAMSLVAADLARRGHRVLAVDLDLEAPAIGHALLDAERLPMYGALDYLVENGIGGVGEGDLDKFVGASQIAQGAGVIHVLPVNGQCALEYPENVMSKLSRAMVEDLPDSRAPVSVREQIFEMVQRFADRQNYDAVLVDARAGMAELAAGPVLGLGATVLLFGTAQQQTLDGYRSLFAALRLLANRNPQSEWRRRLKMVYAKADLGADSGQRFVDDLWELFSNYLYDNGDDAKDLDAFNFAPSDQSAPHFPLVIPFNQGFVSWDPVRNPTQLTSAFYEGTFRPFINAIDGLILPEADSP